MTLPFIGYRLAFGDAVLWLDLSEQEEKRTTASERKSKTRISLFLPTGMGYASPVQKPAR
jgi:hypothetical protein